MSGGLASELPAIPPFFQTPQQQEVAFLQQQNENLYTSTSANMASRKRKADEDLPDSTIDQRMSFSPSPSIQPRALPSSPATQNNSSRPIKKARTNTSGHPLALPRLLETLNLEEMRSLLVSICNRHPSIGTEIVTTAPRPSVSGAISVLRSYQSALRESFPYGDRATSDYAFNRVKPALTDLLDAINDFTPHFLPPNESHPATSFAYLDAATNIVHQLPSWDSYQNERFKQDAYEEMTKSWAAVIKEAAKKGSGIQIQYGGWDQKLARHNELSGGRMQQALNHMRAATGWIGSGPPPATGSVPAEQQGELSIRQQLMSGTYGANNPVQVGPW